MNPNLRRDDGAALVLVLVFLALFGVLIAIILSFAETNFRTTTVLRERKSRAYAADGGIEFAIQALRGDQYLTCPNAGNEDTLTVPPAFSPNTRSVTITCKNLEGNIGFGGGGDAPGLITTDSAPDSITTQGPAFGTIILKGPDNSPIPAIYNAGGFNLTPNLRVQLGDVLQRLTPCIPSTPNPNVKLTVDDPYSWKCTSDGVPDPYPTPPLHGLPSPNAPLSAPAPSPGPGGCKIFHPGKYSGSMPSLGNYNYFTSGVYYLEDVAWTIEKTQILGGKPFPPETHQMDLPGFPQACKADSVADSFGVEFVLGGTSRIEIKNMGNTGNSNAGMELFSRYAQAGPPAEPNIYVVRTTTGEPNREWKAWQSSGPPTSPTPSFNAKTGAPKVFMHGSIYSYDAHIEFFAGSESALGQLRGGAVAKKAFLELSNAAAAGNPGLSAHPFLPDTGSRRLMIRATATGSGEVPVTFQGIIKIVNKTHDPNMPLTLESWRECRDALDAEKC